MILIRVSSTSTQRRCNGDDDDVGEPERTTTGKLSMAEILATSTATGGQPLKFTAYDGSTAGDEDAVLGLELRMPLVRSPIWPQLPANSVLPARTCRVTCRPTAYIPAIRTCCSRR